MTMEKVLFVSLLGVILLSSYSSQSIIDREFKYQNSNTENAELKSESVDTNSELVNTDVIETQGKDDDKELILVTDKHLIQALDKDLVPDKEETVLEDVESDATTTSSTSLPASTVGVKTVTMTPSSSNPSGESIPVDTKPEVNLASESEVNVASESEVNLESESLPSKPDDTVILSVPKRPKTSDTSSFLSDDQGDVVEKTTIRSDLDQSISEQNVEPQHEIEESKEDDDDDYDDGLDDDADDLDDNGYDDVDDDDYDDDDDEYDDEDDNEEEGEENETQPQQQQQPEKEDDNKITEFDEHDDSATTSTSTTTTTTTTTVNPETSVVDTSEMDPDPVELTPEDEDMVIMKMRELGGILDEKEIAEIVEEEDTVEDLGGLKDSEDLKFEPIPMPTDFDSYDQNGDGFLEMEELTNVTGAFENVADAFIVCDKNADGFIDREEFRNAPWDLAGKPPEVGKGSL